MFDYVTRTDIRFTSTGFAREYSDLAQRNAFIKISRNEIIQGKVACGDPVCGIIEADRKTIDRFGYLLAEF